MQENMKKTLSPTMTATQIKAMLRKFLKFGQGGDGYALCVDDPYVGFWVDWATLDVLIDKEFDSP